MFDTRVRASIHMCERQLKVMPTHVSKMPQLISEIKNDCPHPPNIDPPPTWLSTSHFFGVHVFFLLSMSFGFIELYVCM